MRVTKLLQGLVSHELTAYLSVFNMFLIQWIMAILSKGRKPDNYGPHNPLKCSFTNIWGLCSLWIFPLIKLSWHSCSMWEKLGWLNWLWQFLCKWLSSINPKRFYHSYAYSYSLYERERPSFCTGLISRKLCRFLLTFSTSFTSLSVLLLFTLSITFFFVMHGFLFYFT